MSAWELESTIDKLLCDMRQAAQNAYTRANETLSHDRIMIMHKAGK